ncbi:MAG: response regulator transcription factor [Candidatus Omnitrophota bacterium]
MSTVRIVLADDHAMFRAGLKQLLDQEKDFKVVAQVQDGQELLEKLASVKADCVILDLSMPNMDGLTSLKEITRDFPSIKCLILTMQNDAQHFRHALAAGAKGYVLKDSAFEQLALAVKTIMRGKTFVSPGMSEVNTQQYVRSFDQAQQTSLEILTSRERQILSLIAQGSANKNISSQLRISIRTVETHRSHLIHKLGIKTTAGLVKYAMAKGLV